MSTNTQAQGRTHFSERDFTFVADPANDMNRELYRYEIQLQRQLYTGDVTKDAAAKTAALYQNFSITPTSVTGFSATVGTAVDVTLVSASTTGATVEVTTGTLPAGLSLSVVGNTVKLTGTPTAEGSVNVTVTVSKAGFNSKTFTVAGTIAAAV